MQATIHNEFLTLTVDTHGAEAVSLKNAAGEELLWQADQMCIRDRRCRVESSMQRVFVSRLRATTFARYRAVPVLSLIHI